MTMHIDLKEEEAQAFVNNIEESPESKQQRKQALSNMWKAPLPVVKYGLHIRSDPSIDVTLPTSSWERKTKVPPKVLIKESSELPRKDIERKDVLEWYHLTFVNDICSIDIKESTDTPIELHTVIKSATCSTFFISAAPNVKATVLLESENSAFWSKEVIIDAKKGSDITLIDIKHENEQCVQRKYAFQEAKAKVKWVDLCLQTNYDKTFLTSYLQGKAAATEQYVLTLQDKQSVVDIYTAAIHQAEETSSNIITKSVLAGKAKAISRGVINIEQNAAKSQGYEKQEVLLTSEEAEADAIPNLEIHNHDVTCSHGSAIGKLDEEHLFYLQARGLSAQQAKQVLIEGYVAPFLEHLPEEKKPCLRERCAAL